MLFYGCKTENSFNHFSISLPISSLLMYILRVYIDHRLPAAADALIEVRGGISLMILV